MKDWLSFSGISVYKVAPKWMKCQPKQLYKLHHHL